MVGKVQKLDLPKISLKIMKKQVLKIKEDRALLRLKRLQILKVKLQDRINYLFQEQVY